LYKQIGINAKTVKTITRYRVTGDDDRSALGLDPISDARLPRTVVSGCRCNLYFSITEDNALHRFLSYQRLPSILMICVSTQQPFPGQTKVEFIV
jgi:hypothetical protein